MEGTHHLWLCPLSSGRIYRHVWQSPVSMLAAALRGGLAAGEGESEIDEGLWGFRVKTAHLPAAPFYLQFGILCSSPVSSSCQSVCCSGAASPCRSITTWPNSNAF
ncbi:hypothetical protein JOQ06_029042, partial [Pogonophryne albipinna]